MPSASPAHDNLESQTRKVVKTLATLYPNSHCALIHRDPYELLVATILSAQCTDARVNKITPVLFARFPDAAALAIASQKDVEALIQSAGFFRAKAKNLRSMAAQIVKNHEGEVPSALDALTALPGVGRKTANVVLGNAFDIASGVVVDTHVKRLTYRLGLTQSQDPKIIERELNQLVPSKEWVNFSHRLIDHGRKVCIARKPRCSACLLASFCPKVGVTASA